MVQVSAPGRDESGAIALLVAFIAVALLLVVGLVMDLGLARDVRAQSQNAADASALAAGTALYDDQGRVDLAAAVQAAQTYAAENFGVSEADWEGCTDPDRLVHAADGSGCISFDDVARPSKVRVRIPTREVKPAFGGLAGIESIPIGTAAQAALLPGEVYRCALCVLGQGTHDVGNGDITVENSGVHINGSIVAGPNGHVTAVAHQITVEGTATGHNFVPKARTGAGRVGDPLAGLALPDLRGIPAKLNPCADGPGVYGAHELPDRTCVLQPGLYVLTGRWGLKNNTDLRGTGVTLFATCGTAVAPRNCQPGEAGGQFDATNGDVTITAGAIPGIAILYDRHNTAEVRVQGNGVTNITGTVYAASARLYANGNSGNGVTNGSIVVRGIYLNGNKSHLRVTNGLTQTWQRPPGSLHLQN